MPDERMTLAQWASALGCSVGDAYRLTMTGELAWTGTYEGRAQLGDFLYRGDRTKCAEALQKRRAGRGSRD